MKLSAQEKFVARRHRLLFELCKSKFLVVGCEKQVRFWRKHVLHAATRVAVLQRQLAVVEAKLAQKKERA